MMTERITLSGKFFRLGSRKFYLKGFSYGPFAPNRQGEQFPEREQLRRDFRQICELGANTLRIYFPPPEWLMDEAADAGLKVFVDVPWEKHRCFFEDWDALERARAIVRQTARTFGNHPAMFAISVANELPVDVVRFQGRARVQGFLEELLGIVKEEAPKCLATFVNFPTTEFLSPRGCDFCCFNVYIHDEDRFGSYLNRLQHIAGNSPLVISEYGIDSHREGQDEQAALLARHVRQVFRHGLAGSIVFSYTDDWYTGGCQIDDWFFGVTRRDRSEKPAAAQLRAVWNQMPYELVTDLPKVSVVVCSYNGGRTLEECLHSLVRLDYPDHEIILIDDGSTDDTPQIVEGFPQIIYHRQENRGLSAARNVGAELATGEIVAYTDSDCVVDEDWLTYLVQGMQDQQVEAIGGPNITPESDGWMAKCVAASPGNPSHVMLNDSSAEHVPGCNMAFRRSTLLMLGAFDTQFWIAGDDVDICWRLLDAGLRIGYAPGAMVWHHRRTSIRAFSKQQKGYGRSEAMVHFKHPQRCGAFGRSSWKGIIYGDGAVGLPLLPDRIYHGQFGGALFQTIYRHNDYGVWSCVMSLEWHLAAFFILCLAILLPPLALVSVVMWCATIANGVASALSAPLPPQNSKLCRAVVAYLYVMQPVWRGWNRLTYLLRNKKLPSFPRSPVPAKRVSTTTRSLCWDNYTGVGRSQLLSELVCRAKELGWAGDFDNAWSDWDIKLVGDCWHNLTIFTSTEELGWPRRFTRARCSVIPTVFTNVASAVAIVWCVSAVAAWQYWGMALGAISGATVLLNTYLSRHRCLHAATALISQSADAVFNTLHSADRDSEVLDAMTSNDSERNVLVPAAQRDFHRSPSWDDNIRSS